MLYNSIKMIGLFEFRCATFENPKSWGHYVELWNNGEKLAAEKIYYYNRTWESYTYQTAMRRVMGRYKDSRFEALCDDWKKAHNVSRFPKGMRKKLEESFDELPICKVIDGVLGCIESGEYIEM